MPASPLSIPTSSSSAHPLSTTSSPQTTTNNTPTQNITRRGSMAYPFQSIATDPFVAGAGSPPTRARTMSLYGVHQMADADGVGVSFD